MKKNAISYMFTTKLKFAVDYLFNWFNRKFKNKNLKLSNEQKTWYKISNLTNLQVSRCFICSFPHEIRVTGYGVQEKEIQYLDFCIRKEHMFLRNILSKQELNKLKNLKNLKLYYYMFKFFLKNCGSVRKFYK